MAQAIGIPVAVPIGIMGRRHGGAGTRVMGPILFPITLPDVGWLALPAPARRSRKERKESAIRVMGSILFPVTLPIGVAPAIGSERSLRIGPREPFLTRPSPRLPRHDGLEARARFGAASLLFHAAVLTALLVLAGAPDARPPDARSDQVARTRADMPRLVVLMEPTRPGPGGGGGGGGNRQRRPIPRAKAPGRDSVTLPVAKPIVSTTQPRDEAPPPQAVVLDAKPLGSGWAFQVGSLDGVATLGTSRGPGSGGGVGEGVGTGIGSGRGPGLGPGSGGGTGGGVYRPGIGVTSPTLLLQVKPTYTTEALRARIQGSVFLEVVVQSDGTPRDIRVIRSLDPRGLDQQAVLAVEQWRFGPGRLNGEPVDVLVTVVLDFSIR
jgi:periplasmic protein TonB